MTRARLPSLLVLLLGCATSPAKRAALQPDPPIACTSCDEWNRPQEPFKVFGNTYYVGVAGLSSVLIASDDGLILVDAALPQSAPLIDANLRKLGFRPEDIRLIVFCHEHFDHAGGIAALQRLSGAVVATSAPAAQALATGVPTPEDPQYSSGKKDPYPPVKNVRVVSDGEVLRVGSLAITAHATPGHTPGAMSWSWKSCEAGRCLDVVYADSLNPVSDDGYRYTRHPKLLESFRAAIEKFAELPCDVALASHPGAIDLAGKLERRNQNPGENPFIDPNACRALAGVAKKRLETRVAVESQSDREDASTVD